MMKDFMQYKLAQFLKGKNPLDFTKNRTFKSHPTNEPAIKKDADVLAEQTPTTPQVKNTSKVVRKASIYLMAVALCISLASCSAPVDNKAVADDQVPYASEQTQFERDWNRFWGNLFGIDRGNIIEDKDQNKDNDEQPETEKIEINIPGETNPEKPSTNTDTPENETPSDNTSETPSNTDTNIGINTNPNYTGDTSNVDTNVHKVETPTNTSKPSQPATPSVTDSKPVVVEIPTTTQPSVDQQTLNEFDSFVQAIIMIQGQDPNGAKFQSVSINGNSATFNVSTSNGNIQLSVSCPTLNSATNKSSLNRSNITSADMTIVNSLREALGNGSLNFMEEPSM